MMYLLQNVTMPQSRKRQGNHPFKQAADIPKSQRVKGRVIWAILIAVFAVLITFFGAGSNYIVLLLAAVIGALIGYAIGTRMEKDA